MKILLIHDFYQRRGATDAVVFAEKHLLEGCGQEVFFYERDNQEIDHYSLHQKLLLPFKTMYSRQTEREILNVVAEFRPDVAYIHNFLPLVSPSVYHVLRAANIPSVQAIHDFRFLCPNGLFYTQGQICDRCATGNYLHAIRHRCYRDSYLSSAICASAIGFNRFAKLFDKISAFMCFTDFTKRVFLEAGIPDKKIFVKPHFVDASCVQPLYGEGEYVLYLGRLSSEKGVWTLIRAMAKLRDIPLKIAGTGPLEESLRRFVSEKGLTNVECVGFKTGQEKWDLIRKSLFVVVPSEVYETFCLVVIEAYAAGKPVIGANLGSLPYVIEDEKSGLLFEPRGIDELSTKIRDLADAQSRVELMGRYGRMLAETKYSLVESQKLLMDIFRSVSVLSDARLEMCVR